MPLGPTHPLGQYLSRATIIRGGGSSLARVIESLVVCCVLCVACCVLCVVCCVLCVVCCVLCVVCCVLCAVCCGVSSHLATNEKLN